jgi:hypothetical protein
MTKTRKATKPASSSHPEARFTLDLGSCGTRSLNHADARPATPAAPAACQYVEVGGHWYGFTGKHGRRCDDGSACREFARIDDGRLWVGDDGRITLD